MPKMPPELDPDHVPGSLAERITESLREIAEKLERGEIPLSPRDANNLDDLKSHPQRIIEAGNRALERIEEGSFPSFADPDVIRKIEEHIEQSKSLSEKLRDAVQAGPPEDESLSRQMREMERKGPPERVVAESQPPEQPTIQMPAQQAPAPTPAGTIAKVRMDFLDAAGNLVCSIEQDVSPGEA